LTYYRDSILQKHLPEIKFRQFLSVRAGARNLNNIFSFSGYSNSLSGYSFKIQIQTFVCVEYSLVATCHLKTVHTADAEVWNCIDNPENCNVMKYINFKQMLCIVLFPLVTLNIFGQSDKEKGLQIMTLNDELKEPSDAYSESKLLLINRNGNKKYREMKMFTRKRGEEFDTFFEVLSPADVAGMKFLTIGQKGDDEQRMYIPALGRTRRISGSGKDGKFLGSDIFFYDLEDHSLEDFTYKFLRDEKWNGQDYFVVEAMPKSKDAPYSRTLNWVRKDNYFVDKMEMYDRKQGRLWKTMIINETTKLEGIILTVEMAVTNHQDNHETLYTQNNYKVNVGLDKDIFSVRNLEE
jgi:hypothetical protein